MAAYTQTGANRAPRVLYFHAGTVPTEAEKSDAARFAPNVGMRNATAVASLAMSPLEECDAVAGNPIPPRYAENFPSVNDLAKGVMLRMSDLDRPVGLVHSTDNERARAAKPPSIGADLVMAQGATRPAGAITQSNGGFVAPVPGNPDNVLMQGSERAENGPEGTNTEGQQGHRANPLGLPDAGVSLPREGSSVQPAGLVAQGGGVEGFTAPERPEVEEAAEKNAKTKGKPKGGDTGSTGSTGSTGDTGATG